MTRYFLEVMYDGTKFHGSQLQGKIPTVQLAVNQGLSTLIKKDVSSFGASRTDEAVHAVSNFYHFDTEEKLHPHFHYKLNAILPEAISVKAVYQCRGSLINARFDALFRSYRYRIHHSKDPFKQGRAYFFPFTTNRTLLDETAAVITEYQDFESFSKRKAQTKTFRCSIYESRWEELNGELHYVVRANRFLRGMVRALVGTQLQVARGKKNISEFRKIIEAKDCTRADFSVPGHGLYLERIEYPEGTLTKLDLM